jgi:Fic family protein
MPRRSLASLISRLAEVRSELQKLPPLPPTDKVKLQQEQDIEHLYYSSKLEGTNLSDRRLTNAIHGASL